MTTKLQRTYGNFRVRGIVRQIDTPYAFEEQANNTGTLYRRLRFLVQTNEKSFVPVELFGMKFEEVTITPEDRNSKQRKRIKYSDNLYDEIPNGWEIFMGTRVGLEQDDKGNNIIKRLFAYDAVKEIHQNLKNGDPIFISGSIQSNEYRGATQQTFEIRNIYASSEEIDFNDEKFSEMSTFDQTFVLTDSEVDRENNRLNINANIIYDKDGLFVPASYYVDIKKYKGLGLNLHRLKFGTEIKVSGILHSTAEVDTDTSNEEVDEWGEDLHQSQNQIITNTNKSFEITKGYKETIKEALYSEEDFKVKQEDDFSDDWGEETSDEEDPFESDDKKDENPFL